MNSNIAMKGKVLLRCDNPPEGAEHFPYLILSSLGKVGKEQNHLAA